MSVNRTVKSCGGIGASDAVWATVRAAASGTVDETPGAFGVYAYVYSGVYYLARGFFGFEFGTTPPLTEARLYFFYSGSQSEPTKVLTLVEGTQASVSSITGDDFDQVGGVELADRLTISSGGTKYFTLNAAGRALVEAGNPKFAMLEAPDTDNEAPTDEYSTFTVNRTGFTPYLALTGSLAAPTNLAATPGAAGAVVLTWTKTTGATGYRVYHGGTDTPTTLLAEVGDVATYSTVAEVGVHYYRVVAICTGWDASAYSAAASATVVTTPPVSLNFGNGVVAGGHSTDSVRIKGHSGIEFPDVDLPSDENSLLDGGVVWGSRAKMRRMTVALDFGESMTRREIAAAFAPTEERLLTSARASIPYWVERLSFGRENLNDPQTVSLTMLSSDAYPEGTEHEELDLGPGVSFETYSEVDCWPVVTVTADASGQVLTVTSDAGLTTVSAVDASGTIDASSVVVIDSTEHSVTVDGVDRLDWFDRSGVWPKLSAGSNSITAALDGAEVVADVEWRPRLLGLF